MERYENQCVGCPTEKGCLGNSCPNRNVRVFYCDHCGDELDPDDMYEVDGEDLCASCLMQMFKKEV